MKIHYVTLVTSLYVAVTLASTNIDTYGSGNQDKSRELFHSASQGDNRSKASKSLRDHQSFNGLRDRHAEAGSKYAGSADSYGHKAAKAAAHGNSAERNFAKQDAKYDEIARQIAAAAKVRGYHSGSEGRYDKVDSDKARGYNSAAAKKNAYHRGKVFNDNIVYGFNKDFKQDLSERGGYEEEHGHKKHKLDEYKDRQRAHKLIRGEHSAANAREDAQRALKESKYDQKAAQKQAARGKYGNSEKKEDKAGATEDAQSVLFDRKDSKYSAEDKGHQLAAKKANEFAKKDNNFGRQAAASHGGAQGHADKKYYGGHNNKDQGVGGGGYGDSPNLKGPGITGHHEGSGGLANHKYGEEARQSDVGKEHLAQNAGASDQALKQYDQTKKKQDFNQLKSLRDQRKGKFAQGVHNAQKNGFNAKDSEAAKSASGGDRKYADATAQSKAKAAKHDLDEELFDKENYKKQQHDDNENYRKVKKFYHDKKSGGKNIESLRYNRKRVENEFGSAQSAQQEKQNQYDNAHKAAKHHAASRKDDYVDKKKASQAFGHHDANRVNVGKANNRASDFKKSNNFDYGNKKQVGESDYSNHRDVLKKKQQQYDDKVSNAASVKGNGYKNVNSEEREDKGSASGIKNFGLAAAHRDNSFGVHQNVAPVHDIDVPHAAAPVHDIQDAHRGGNSGYGNTQSRPHIDSVRGKNFGNFGNTHRPRSLGRSSGYGSDIHKIGGLFGGGNSYGRSRQSSFDHGSKPGLFSNFGGSFGGGSSHFKNNNYASRSGTRNSVFHKGSLFNSPFGSTFNRPSIFTSRFRFRNRKSLGGLF